MYEREGMKGGGKKSETPSPSQLSNTDDRRNGYTFDIKNEKKKKIGKEVGLGGGKNLFKTEKNGLHR